MQNNSNIILQAKGYSMYPLLIPGDRIYIRAINISKIKLNDIIALMKGSQIITHRVIYKDTQFLITKGDTNKLSDGKIFPSQIIGKVFKVKRQRRVFSVNSQYFIQSTHYLKEIIKINSSFIKEGLEYLFLKGLPLYLYYERKYPRRLYADCDVLINSKEKNMVEKNITNNGFQKLNDSWLQFQRRVQKKFLETSFYKKTTKTMIIFDVHLQLVDLSIVHLGHFNDLYPQKFIDQLTDKFLKTKRKIKIKTNSFYILEAKYLIIYLLLHLFHHNFEGAFRYQFLSVVVRKEIGKKIFLWKKIADLIKKYDLQTFIYPGLVLLQKYYFLYLPPTFLQTIKPRGWITQVIIDGIIKKTDIFSSQPRIKAGITRFFYLFLLSPRPWWQRIMVFIQPGVFFSVLWIFKKKFLRNNFPI